MCFQFSFSIILGHKFFSAFYVDCSLWITYLPCLVVCVLPSVIRRAKLVISGSCWLNCHCSHFYCLNRYQTWSQGSQRGNFSSWDKAWWFIHKQSQRWAVNTHDYNVLELSTSNHMTQRCKEGGPSVGTGNHTCQHHSLGEKQQWRWKVSNRCLRHQSVSSRFGEPLYGFCASPSPSFYTWHQTLGSFASWRWFSGKQDFWCLTQVNAGQSRLWITL